MTAIEGQAVVTGRLCRPAVVVWESAVLRTGWRQARRMMRAAALRSRYLFILGMADEASVQLAKALALRDMSHRLMAIERGGRQ